MIHRMQRGHSKMGVRVLFYISGVMCNVFPWNGY